ncbi:unnamed protein product [Brugia timori]|uniref:HSF_DOMAIN domain-containing protein n=1 Tax=Brugia timori TaxID=42155 RepID=A0A0R3Q536_9BILA|nr:unnamed protein product [Brugia timori]
MESISSGVNFLRRRFSSQDIEEDDKSMFTSVLGGRSVQQHQQQAQYQQQQQQSSSASLHIQSGPPNSFSLAGLANKVSSAIRLTFELYSWNSPIKGEFIEVDTNGSFYGKWRRETFRKIMNMNPFVHF